VLKPNIKTQVYAKRIDSTLRVKINGVSTDEFSWDGVCREALLFERRHDSAAQRLTCFAAVAVVDGVRPWEIVVHLGLGEVQLDVTAVVNVDTTSHVRHYVVLYQRHLHLITSQFTHHINPLTPTFTVRSYKASCARPG